MMRPHTMHARKPTARRQDLRAWRGCAMARCRHDRGQSRMRYRKRLALGCAMAFGWTVAAFAQGLPEIGPVQLQTRGIDITLGAGASFQGAVFDGSDARSRSPDGNIDLFAEINAQWTSPGGILVGANVKASDRTRQTEAFDTGEAYLFVASDLGRIEIGRQDGPADTLSFHAPNIALGQIRGDSSRYAGGRALLSPLDTQDAFKLIYLSPPIANIRAGISWSPEVNRNPDAPDPRARTQLRNAVELGVQYQQPVGDWVLGLSAAFAGGNARPETGRADLRSWSVGGEARRGPLRLGAAFVDRGDSNRLDRDFNQREVNAGLGWVEDRWGLALSAHRTRSTPRVERGIGLGGFFRLTRNIELRADLVGFEEMRRSDGRRRGGTVALAEIQLSL